MKWPGYGHSMEGFGVLKGSSKAASPSPHPARREGVPVGCLLVPILAPPSTPLGWRCLPGALRPPHTLPAVCFQFLLASAPPCLLPIKKRGKKYPRHLLGVRLPEAPVSWGCAGGDGGCPRCPTSLLVPVYVGYRAGNHPATSLRPGLSPVSLSSRLLHQWGLGPTRLGDVGSSGCLRTCPRE